jgi:hypothetical protein
MEHWKRLYEEWEKVDEERRRKIRELFLKAPKDKLQKLFEREPYAKKLYEKISVLTPEEIGTIPLYNTSTPRRIEEYNMNDVNDALRLADFLRKNRKYVTILKLALAHETQNEGNQDYKGWAWHDVRAYPPTILGRLIAEGIIRINYKSRRYTNYLLNNREVVRKVLKELEMEEIGKIFKTT